VKFSLTQQIEEVERELKMRGEVYPQLVRKGSMRQSVADYHMGRMRAVLETLNWLSDNRTKVIEQLRKGAELVADAGSKPQDPEQHQAKQ
jgi:hypothetical protein